MGQNTDHRVPHGQLSSHVEVGVVSELESRHIGGVVKQNILPCIRCLGKVPTRNKLIILWRKGEPGNEHFCGAQREVAGLLHSSHAGTDLGMRIYRFLTIRLDFHSLSPRSERAPILEIKLLTLACIILAALLQADSTLGSVCLYSSLLRSYLYLFRSL